MRNTYPIPLAFGYQQTSTEIGAQKCVNMYPNSQRGARQYPGLDFQAITGAGLDILQLENVQTALDAVDNGCTGLDMTFNGDGTKVFISLLGGATLISWFAEFALSTAYDLSTASYTDNFNYYAARTGIAVNHIWNDDGTKLYVLAAGAVKDWAIEEFACTAYDISTASFTDSLEFEADDWTLTALAATVNSSTPRPFFNDDGSKLYLAFARVNTPAFDSQFYVIEYGLSTNYDVSTGTLTGATLLETGNSIDDGGLNVASTFDAVFSASGDVLYIATGSRVVFFACSTAFDATTATRTVAANIAGFPPSGLAAHHSDNDRIFGVTLSAANDTNLLEFVESSGESERGGIVMAGVPYVCVGNILYTFNSSGILSFVAVLDPGISQRGIWSTDGETLVVTFGAYKYEYSVAGGLVSITDADLSSADANAYLDGRWYYSQPSGIVAPSDPNDPTAIDPLEKFTAESMADDVSSVIRAGQLLYIWGPRSLELYKTRGVIRPPVGRQKVIERGIIGTYARDQIDSTVYFLDDNRRPCRMVQLELQEIPVPALGIEWDTYATVSDCIVAAYTVNQERFVDFHFPTANATWTLHEPSGVFFKLEDQDGNFGRVRTYLRAYGKLWGLDHTKFMLYVVDPGTYTNVDLDSPGLTEPLPRVIHTQVVSASALNVQAERMHVHCIKVGYVSTGAATISLSVGFEENLDSFSTAESQAVTAGRGVLEFWRIGPALEVVAQVSCSSNAKVDVTGVWMDLEFSEDVEVG